MKFGHLDQTTALELYERILMPTLTYGTELTVPSQTCLGKADSAQARILRQILGLGWNANTKWTLWEAGAQSAQTRWEENVLRLAMKIQRTPNSHLIKRIQAELNSLQYRGRPLDLHVAELGRTLAEKWGVQRWLWNGLYKDTKSNEWKGLRDQAVQKVEEQRFDDWACSRRYHSLKPWFGTSDLHLELSSHGAARAISLARANQIGVGSDHTHDKHGRGPLCLQCDSACPDTLEHTVWSCPGGALGGLRARLYSVIEETRSSEQDWASFRDKPTATKLDLLLHTPEDQDETLEERTVSCWEALVPLLREIQRQRDVHDF
jgi:hypothetical protein